MSEFTYEIDTYNDQLMASQYDNYILPSERKINAERERMRREFEQEMAAAVEAAYLKGRADERAEAAAQRRADTQAMLRSIDRQHDRHLKKLGRAR